MIDSTVFRLALRIEDSVFQNKVIRSFSDAEKQDMCEELIGQILIISAMNRLGQSDPQMKEVGQSYGRNALKQIGLDYTKLDYIADDLKPR
jgi:hypothetical protein